MRKLMSLAACIVTGACADQNAGYGPLEVLDPAPFDPTLAATNSSSSAGSYEYKKLACQQPDKQPDKQPDLCANLQLRQLAADYAQHRNAVMRGTYLFDIPLVGLAATLAVGAGNHFASTTMAGLAVSSAGFLGARTYLSPGTKAAAYGAASAALQCGAAGAERLQAINDGQNPQGIADVLQASIDTAIKADKSDPLLPAAEAAQKPLADAIAVLNGAPARLGFIAATIVRNTTQKITTGTQDISSLLSQIQGAGTSGSAKPAVKSQQAPIQLKSLVASTADANGVTQDIKDAWSDMVSCTIVKAAS